MDYYDWMPFYRNSSHQADIQLKASSASSFLARNSNMSQSTKNCFFFFNIRNCPRRTHALSNPLLSSFIANLGLIPATSSIDFSPIGSAMKSLCFSDVFLGFLKSSTVTGMFFLETFILKYLVSAKIYIRLARSFDV